MSSNEKMLSELPAIGPFHNHRACLIGFAGKGPIGLPTQVANAQQLYHFYGTSGGETPLVLAAEQVLSMDCPLLMLRVADEAAKSAAVGIPCGTDNIILSPLSGPYAFKKNSFFRWSCDGVISSKILVALQGTCSATILAAQFNDQVKESQGIYFYDHDGKLAIRCNGQLSLESVQDAVYDVLGLGDLVSSALLISDCNNDVELQDGQSFQITVSGSGNLTVDNITQTISFKSVSGRRCSPIELVNCVNSQLSKNLPGGFLAVVENGYFALKTIHKGSEAAIAINAASTARKTIPFSCLRAGGASEVMEGTSDGQFECFTIQAESPGTVGNTIKVQIEPGDGDTFGIRVFHDNALVESWTNLNKLQKDKFYVESFINLVSNWIRVIDNPTTSQRPRFGTYQLGKKELGSDGMPETELKKREILLGSNGLQSLEKEEYDIDLIAMPGENSIDVCNGLLKFCDKRGDCLAIIDAPKGISYNEATKWKKQLSASENACVFWPWVKVWDAKNRAETWIPPSGSIVATLARCDSVSCVWNSASGPYRGIVPGILDVLNRPKVDRNGLRLDSDLNCILGKDGVFFIHNEGTLNGGKISLRRLVFLLKKLIRTGIDTLLRDCKVTDDYFAENFIRICDHILKQVKHRQGIQYYHIKAGDEINTPEVRAKGGFRAQIGVQPSNSTVWVSFDFSAHEAIGQTQQRVTKAQTGVASKRSLFKE